MQQVQKIYAHVATYNYGHSFLLIEKIYVCEKNLNLKWKLKIPESL